MLELFRRMWVGWQAFARGILSAQNAVLMGAAYFLAIGPAALAFRVVGRSLLDRAPADPGAPSYWTPRDGAPLTMERAARPF